MMKKVFYFLVLGLLSVTLIGCEEKEKDNKKDNDSKIEEIKDKKEVLDINDELVLTYYNLIADDPGEFYSAYLCKKDTKVEDLNYLALFNIAARKLTKDEVVEKNGAYFYIKREDLIKRAKEIFGEDIKLDFSQGTDLNLFVQKEGSPISAKTLFGSYVEKDDTYELYWGGIGGNCGLDDCSLRRAKLDSAYIEDDKLYITEKQMFEYQDWHFEKGFEKATLYSDYDKTKEIGTYNETSLTAFEEFFDKAGTVTYVFEKGTNDEYIFVQSIVK